MTAYTHRRNQARSRFIGYRLPGIFRCLSIVALTISGFAQAQTWPTKPVRLVVPISAGGATDLLARMVGQALTKRLGQPFIVDQKPGAAGAIASLDVARAPADGYTFLVATSSTHAVAPAVFAKLRYDPVKDFTPIGLLAEANNVLLVSPKTGATNMKELLDLARKKPGYLNFASSGVGSFGHLTFELFQHQAGVSLTHVPYKGNSAAIPDLMAGTTHLAADSLSTGLPYVRDGRLRGLAVTGSHRSPLAPDIPTIAESGLPGFSVVAWFGLFAPAGLSPELTQHINDELNKVLKSPALAENFATLGIEPGHGSSAEFATMVANDRARWTSLAKQFKIKLD